MTQPDASPYGRSYEAIHRFVRRRAFGDRADDLTQEVFADAAEALAQARLEAPPPLAWLYAVARRRLVDLARQRPEPVSLETQPELEHPEPRYADGVVAVLVEAVRLLPETQRPLVVGKVFQGRGFREMAAELGISEEAARMRFSRGLARLRDELQRKGVRDEDV